MSTAIEPPGAAAMDAAAGPAPATIGHSPGSGMALEQLIKSLAAITAVFYVAGFLTTNAYLYRLGVSDFSLLRTRFVLTGVLTVAPLVLALAGGMYAAVDTAAYGGPGRTMSRASLWILADLAVPFALYFLLFWFVSGNDPGASARDAALLSAMCAVVVIAFMAVLALFRASGRRPVSHLVYNRKSVSYERFTRWFGVPDSVVECLVFAVAGPLLLFGYIAVFGDHFYPLIPEQIGGGRPRHVQLLVATHAISGARELGLDVAEEAPLSPPVQLLWEGEQAYVIRLPPPREGSVVQLSRGLVDGVVTGAVIPLAESAPNGSGESSRSSPLASLLPPVMRRGVAWAYGFGRQGMERGVVNRRQLLRYGMFGAGAAALGPEFLPGRARQADGLRAIERIAIHPAIGIARVGNSPDGWFLGPESPGPQPVPDGGYKDETGRIRRQAARFRLYGLDGDGNIVQEITAADADIRWTVRLANTKAAWYEFHGALDLPAARGLPPAPGYDAPPPARVHRRNATIEEGVSLVIDPGERSVAGANANPDGGDPAARFDGGRFFDIEISLGELRTDEVGRLLVLGGHGASGAALPGIRALSIDNNDYWYDDIGDGPVDATVTIDGRGIPVTGAWVVTAPPNYAPGMQSVVTMYDLVFETATRLQPELAPARPSFTRMIYPLFARMTQNQWVNAGFLHEFGWGAPSDFLAPAQLARLSSAAAEDRFLREQVFARFRDPAFLSMEHDKLPPYYGDSVNFPGEDPRQWMAVLPLQYGWLRQWAEGDFDADWPVDGLTFPARLEDLPIVEQPGALDRAALDDCLGGPFHPGPEMTWPMRQTLLYEAPFRLRRRTEPEPDWGPEMTSEIALADDGPLRASGPGDLTRWLSVPWQTDVASCLAGYEGALDEYLPAFWPARVPNDVLTPESYALVMDSGASLEQRQRAFAHRVKWLRDLPGFGGSNRDRMNAFIRQWGDAGVVTRHPGPGDDAPFPETFWVELGHALGAEER